MNILLFVVLIALSIFSYGFKDPNLVLTSNPTIQSFIDPLFHFVYYERSWATALFFLFLLFLFGLYITFLKNTPKKIAWMIIVGGIILTFSYPALTYDLFNYMTTAKVAFAYHENPYIVMPIEIPNEPYLAFTRAANKVALYGPVWILMTAIPHYLGGANIWQTTIMFKLMNVIFYFLFVILIYRVTKSAKNVLFFALNPLILIETLVSGHNDIVMMTFVISGTLLWFGSSRVKRAFGAILVFLSVFTKGAPLVLFPLFFFKISMEKFFMYSYILFSTVFFVLAPIREELYPWYAVWLVATAAFLNMKKYSILVWFTIVLTFALELRHLPYMWMGYYEGSGPLLRLLVTIVPIAVYLGWIFKNYAKKYFGQR